MKNLTLTEFAKQTASKSPTPGGGGVAALTASNGIALVAMLANLTLGKKGYEDVQQKMQEVAQQAQYEAQALLDEIQADADVFNRLMQCYRMPKNTPEEIQQRAMAIQNATLEATIVPLNLARKAYGLMEIADIAVSHGYKGAISDGAVGTILLKSAALAAMYNVRINLPVIADQERHDAIKMEADAIERGVHLREQAILAKVVL